MLVGTAHIRQTHAPMQAASDDKDAGMQAKFPTSSGPRLVNEPSYITTPLTGQDLEALRRQLHEAAIEGDFRRADSIAWVLAMASPTDVVLW